MLDEKVSQGLTELRNELVANLNFFKELIEKDRKDLQNYVKRFGDLRYRPKMGDTWGEPTELVLTPLASRLRTTIKSLLDSIVAIEVKLHGGKEEQEEDSIPGAEEFDAEKALKEARRKAK